MADVFHLQIISPAATVVDGSVSMVEVPGTEGDFGVLPRHAPFFSMIRPGVIRVALPDGQYRRFFAAAGYADVSPEGSCTILSEHIQDLNGVTSRDAAEALSAAQAALSAATTDAERTRAEKLLIAAEALVLAVAA
jgi:F-type H+-transporting ATPase subunit epsilon